MDHDPDREDRPSGDPHQPVDGPVPAARPIPPEPGSAGIDPMPGPRDGWSWRSTIAGAVAGGVIAACVAVPLTWALGHGSYPGRASAGADQGQAQQLAPPEGGGGPVDPFGGAGGFGDPSQDQVDGRATDQTDVTQAESRGVVLIDTVTTSGAAAGTGLVIDASGLVLTNYHVVGSSTSVRATVATTGETYDATVLGHDAVADIALLQLRGASGLPTVTLDDDDQPAVSDEVTAVGNARGQGYLSAATGTVKALDQSITTDTTPTATGEKLSGLIRTDAAVVGGYSGGALLDDEDEVVGITTAAATGGAAQSYAVPIDDALDIAGQIEDGRESADVQVGPSPYLGVVIDDAAGNVQVVRVEHGSAAGAAGVRAGAVITALDDTSVASLEALRTALAGYQPGDPAVLHWTDASGSSHRGTVTLGESPVN